MTVDKAAVFEKRIREEGGYGKTSYSNNYTVWKMRGNIVNSVQKEVENAEVDKLSILDVGCDRGDLDFLLVDLFRERIALVCIDISEESIWVANSTKRILNVNNCHFYVQNAESMTSIQGSSCDIVICRRF